MRVILRVKRDTHIEDILTQLNFLDVQQIIESNTLKFIFKIDSGLAPNYLKKFLIKRKNNCSYPVRSGEMFQLPKFRKNITQNSLFYKGLTLYNKFNNVYPQDRNMIKFQNDCYLFITNQ